VSLAVLFLSAGCSAFVPGDEISRVTSPDSVVDAVLVEVDGGALSSNEQILYIVPKGEKYEKGHELFVGDHIEGLKVFWKQDKFLVIQYDQGRVFRFSSFWESREVQNFRYVVELRLMPTAANFSLSEEDRRLKY
jgi:hypothetical protein